jgi:sulfoxide reductase heme-binding subunit YedZ
MAGAAHTQLFWVTSRAAGTAALLFSSVAVGLGLTMSMRLLKGRGPDLRVAHEALSLATMVALVVHGVSLLGDGWLKPGLADLTIPFAGDYRQPWLSAGIVAGWAMLVLGLSFYARGRIGQQRWRRLHRFTALAWLAAVLHALGTGSDAGRVWFVVALGIVVLPSLVLLANRWLDEPEAPPRAATR